MCGVHFVEQQLTECSCVHSFEDAYEGYAEALRMDAENTKMASKLLCKRAIAALKLKRCAPRQCNRFDICVRSCDCDPSLCSLTVPCRFEHAIQDASAALYFNPQYAKAFATRAASHVELDSYELAEQDYNNAAQIEPWEREHERQLLQVRKEIKARAKAKK